MNVTIPRDLAERCLGFLQDHHADALHSYDDVRAMEAALAATPQPLTAADCRAFAERWAAIGGEPTDTLAQLLAAMDCEPPKWLADLVDEPVPLTAEECFAFAARVNEIDGLPLQGTRDALVGDLARFGAILRDWHAWQQSASEETTTTEQENR